jgi:hypothetical protein
MANERILMQDARQVEWSALRSGGIKRDGLVHRKNWYNYVVILF